MAALRIGIIGARTRRQGLGPHVARWLHRLGAEIPAIVGTSEATLAAAQAGLQRSGIPAPRGYLSLRQMLDAESLDAVAICSPDAAHRQALHTIADAGLHALCDKPLVFDPDRDNASDVRELVAQFSAQRRWLIVNEQWPFTLPACEALRRQQGLSPSLPHPKHFCMLLSPAVAGRPMLPHALPHAISLLFALVGCDGAAHALRIVPGLSPAATAANRQTPDDVRVDFDYRHAAGTTQVAVRLLQCQEQPRPAAYGVDGWGVARVIEPRGYQQFFVPTAEPLTGSHIDGDRAARWPLADPLGLLLEDFLKKIAGETPLLSPALERSAALLDRVWRAWEHSALCGTASGLDGGLAALEHE